MIYNFKKKLIFISFISILMFSFYLRYFNLDQYPGINADESWMANKAYYISKTSLIQNFRGMDNYTGILTPALMRIWGEIFGFTHYSMRLLSIFFSLITISLTFIICLKLFSFISAFFSTILLSISLFFICYSRIAVPHIWITPFILVSYYLLYYFIETNKNKKYLLLIIIFLIALAVQLHPPPIIFFLFLLFVTITKKEILYFYKSKYFPFFIIIFILGTSSIFIYTFKTIINIIKMNINYIEIFGFYNVILKLIIRIPVYFETFILTISGWRSILYFSGAVTQASKNYFLITGFIFLFPILVLFKSKDKNDIFLFKYIILNLLILPFFLEFFNKNMHLPLLGEERYFMILFPFIIIGLVRSWLFVFKNRMHYFYTVMSFLILFFMFIYVNKYIMVFNEIGGTDGTSLDRVIYAVNNKPITEEIWDYLKKNKDLDLDKDIFVAPSFWMFHPLKFSSLDNIKNLYFWPEKYIPKIWITDNNYLPYKYATIGWKQFLENFKEKKVYLIAYTDSRLSNYLKRLDNLSIEYSIIKTFEKKNNIAVAKLYKINF